MHQSFKGPIRHLVTGVLLKAGPRPSGPAVRPSRAVGRGAFGPPGRWAAGPWRAVDCGPLGRGPAFSKTSCYRAESRAHNAEIQGLLIRFLLLTIQRPFLSDAVTKNCELESAFVQGL